MRRSKRPPENGLKRGEIRTYAFQVVELAEMPISGAEKSLEQIDDSSGDVMPAIMELEAVHLKACRQTHPDPLKLAERLFRFQTEGVWETFYDVLPAYADVLEEQGMQRYRTLVTSAWDKLAELPPSNEFRRSFEPLRMRLDRAMEAIAKGEGDVDALVRIRSKDLSSPYRFLLVAELCMQHARYDDGLSGAERGLSEFGKNVDQRLLTFCIEEYLRRTDFAKADVYAWRRSEMHPTAEGFAELMETASATNQQDLTRERALDYLWERVRDEEAPTKATRGFWQAGTRTQMLKLYRSKHDYLKAWKTFCGGPVATHTWAQMAAVRAKTHPHDAIALYHRLLPITADSGSRKARYGEAFGIVRTIGDLRTELKEHALLVDELRTIRETYRAKRNFMKLPATSG